MKDSDSLRSYIYDLGILLKEKAREAKIEKNNSSLNDLNYQLGYLMAFHDVISLMKQEANAFDLNQDSIGLDDIDPESELL